MQQKCCALIHIQLKVRYTLLQLRINSLYMNYTMDSASATRTNVHAPVINMATLIDPVSVVRNRGLRVCDVMRVAGVTSERGARDECVCEQARAARARGALSVAAAHATSQRRAVLQQRHTQHRTPSSCDTRCLPPLKRSTSTCFHVEVLLT